MEGFPSFWSGRTRNTTWKVIHHGALSRHDPLPSSLQSDRRMYGPRRLSIWHDISVAQSASGFPSGSGIDAAASLQISNASKSEATLSILSRTWHL